MDVLSQDQADVGVLPPTRLAKAHGTKGSEIIFSIVQDEENDFINQALVAPAVFVRFACSGALIA